MGLRVHILGASGAGTSTLARTLANRLDSQAFDTDDFYWVPTDPPFERKRPAQERLRLMEAVFLGRGDWLLAGAFTGWGEAAILPRLTHVVFLHLSAAERLDRLARREVQRYGAAVLPGGPWAARCESFLDWAACYDDPSFDGRSRVQQEAWLQRLAVPVIRLDAAMPAGMLADAAMMALDQGGARATG